MKTETVSVHTESLPSSTTCHGDILKISVELTNIFRLFPRQAGLLEFTDSQFSKDSILIESSSQGYSSQSNTEKKLNSFSMLDIFDEKQIFRLFSEGKD